MTKGSGLSQTARGGLLAAIELLCLAAAGVAAAAFMWAVLEPAPAQPMTGLPIDGFTSSLPPVAALPGSDPFFRGPTTLAGAAPSASAQGFVLHATRVAGGSSTAIISAEGLPQTAYRVGDVIGDAKLVDVMQDQVVIERGSERLTIAFPPSQGFIPQGGAAAVSGPGPAPPGLGLAPISRDGRPDGYQVDGSNGVLSAAGFVAGDIILDVNGASVSPETFESLQSRLVSGGSAEIRFERNGQTMTKRIEGSAQ